MRAAAALALDLDDLAVHQCQDHVTHDVVALAASGLDDVAHGMLAHNSSNLLMVKKKRHHKA